MTEIIAGRAFSPLYIVFDIAFLVIFAGLLLWKKRYMTVLVGFLAGLLYMIVDFGGLYKPLEMNLLHGS